MAAAKAKPTCPHCGSELLAFELPEAGGWDVRHHLACFNDDCSYFRRGWEWMMSRYSRKASYRYRIDPSSGHESPLAVWSETALRDRIVTPKTEEAGKPRPKPVRKKAGRSRSRPTSRKGKTK
ncbi:MAG: hypothetical protein HY897_00625 [Deltaproteobacteria bacterium]|nr:hypothetical protein [Deltaproteobacteria bacterium]